MSSSITILSKKDIEDICNQRFNFLTMKFKEDLRVEQRVILNDASKEFIVQFNKLINKIEKRYDQLEDLYKMKLKDIIDNATETI